MKIKTVKIHNFRSIEERSFDLVNYSLLVGANDSGKSNIIDAIRVFYDDLKFNEDKDWPKFTTSDNESWIEIKFLLSDEEFNNLKEEYKQEDNKEKFFIVRKYLKHPTKIQSGSSNIYGYEKGSLSDNFFYGWKNVAKGKLGDVLYIPAVSQIADYTKFSGPSYLRNILDFICKKIVSSGESFNNLNKTFNEFTKNFRQETTKEGLSLEGFEKDINEDIKDRKVRIGFDIRSLDVADITKNLIEPYIRDEVLGDHKLSIESFGEGLQRRLVYTLIKLSTKYKEKKSAKDKKEFFSNFLLILFEEPEAFLHSSQQEILNQSLKELSAEGNQQVLISTHSVHFVSKNIDNLPAILKLYKQDGRTHVYQITEPELKQILIANKDLKKILGETIEAKDLDLEAIRYSLWLDPDRCCAFFADFVLICEGASEKILIDYLIKNKEIEPSNKEIYILNAMGKENIHRYMNLFKELGIKHSILFDGDKNSNNQDRHQKINKFLQDNKNKYTIAIDYFENNLECFLNIPEESRRDKKPLNVMWHYENSKIQNNKLIDFKEKIKKLLG
jgi:predicted ATP-dependent endonuclease of OLD family